MISVIGVVALWLYDSPPAPWSEAEVATLETLTLSHLPPLPADPSNAVADDPAAVKLGWALFFDERLSGNGQFSCASCHRPAQGFTDGRQLAEALGKAGRNTPSIVGTAYSPWLYWDGRKDSQWSQALAPLEAPNEQGTNRMRAVRLLWQDPDYRRQYESLFGPMPDFSDESRFPKDAGPIEGEADWQARWQAMTAQDRQQVNAVFANLGKVIAAYERRLMPGVSRFDHYVDGLLEGKSEAALAQFLDEQERRGLRLFIGEARCLECHNGPLFTNNEFHNTGLLPLAGMAPDAGRGRVIDTVRQDVFNCLGPYSDADPDDCLELRFMREGPELIGAMRTPSLRNLADTAPYMHKGQMATLSDVLAHYNTAPEALIGHNESEPLDLSAVQLRQIEAFLQALQAPLDVEKALLRPPPQRQASGQDIGRDKK